MKEGLVDEKLAGIFLGVKLATLYGWTCLIKIPFFRLSGHLVRFDKSELEAWLRARHVPPEDSGMDEQGIVLGESDGAA